MVARAGRAVISACRILSAAMDHALTRRRRCLPTVVLLASLTSACATAAGDWRERTAAEQWVTARTTMLPRRQASDPYVVQVVVTVGGQQRVVYQAQATDWNVSHPVVSRDGTRVAFARIELIDDEFRETLHVVGSNGEDLHRVLMLRPAFPRFTGHKWWHYRPPDVAWSHDNSALLVQQSMGTSDGHEQRLLWLDVQSGATRVLKSLRRHPDHALHPLITNQAWAPDGRRLVYTNGAGRATILDTRTGVEEDLGPGLYPTWSGDGGAIAVKESMAPGAKSRDMGDYFVVAAAPPHGRTLLRSNPRSSGWYFGPALWTPDGRHVVIWRTEMDWGAMIEVERPYVQELTTGRTGRIPPELRSYSVGGRP
jgi:hypothetical protein